MKLFLKHNKGYIYFFSFSMLVTIIYCNCNEFIPFEEDIYIFVLNTFLLVSFLIFKYFKNIWLYKLFNNGVDSLNNDLTGIDNTDLGKSFIDVFSKQQSLYFDEMQKQYKVYEEHMTFINQWIHQMKTPISIIKLITKEFEGEEKIFEIEEEVGKINKSLNLAMYYSRLDYFEKDFSIEEIIIRDLVIDTINNNKSIFIKNKIVPKVQIDKEIKVYSDVKWLKFILEQLIINGVKYSKGIGTELIIKGLKNESEIKLSVIDNGIGIYKKDIKRIFNKFFTGENGRKFGESTGMGLYITKEVCENLGHEIEVESTINKGTTVTIKFSLKENYI